MKLTRKQEEAIARHSQPSPYSTDPRKFVPGMVARGEIKLSPSKTTAKDGLKPVYLTQAEWDDLDNHLNTWAYNLEDSGESVDTKIAARIQRLRIKIAKQSNAGFNL